MLFNSSPLIILPLAVIGALTGASVWIATYWKIPFRRLS